MMPVISSSLDIVAFSDLNNMKIHCHIPTLHQFALDSACTGVVKHGKQGLVKPMPKPLYYRCIQTYAGKLGDVIGVKELYDATRALAAVNWQESSVSHACAIVALDHLVVHEVTDDIYSLVIRLLASWENDGSVECVYRAANRCASAQKLGDVFEQNLGDYTDMFTADPPKFVVDLLRMYGATILHSRSSLGLVLACRWGNIPGIQTIINAGFRTPFEPMHLVAAIESCDIPTIKFISEQFEHDSRVLDSRTRVDASCFTIELCEYLLQTGLIQRGKRYYMRGIRSIPLVQWFLDRDMIDVGFTLLDTAASAVRFSGLYVELLHYLVEDLSIPVPVDALLYICLDGTIDLGVVDYLLACGADINATIDVEQHGIGASSVVVRAPLLLRYWVDNGFKFDVDAVVDDLLDYHLLRENAKEFCAAIKMFIELYDYDVSKKLDDGDTLLHIVIESGSSKFASSLIDIGADVNAINSNGATPLHIACQNNNLEVVNILCHRGANVNARDHSDVTPLQYCCRTPMPSFNVIKTLTNHGA